MGGKNGLWRWACAALALLCAAEGAWIACGTAGAPRDAASLYAAAVRDAVFADEEELAPLVALTRGSAQVTWDEAGERVLLLTWHAEPDAYPANAQIEALPGEVWVFTDAEIRAWYARNKKGVADWTLRLEQLIGLPPGYGCTHVSALWTRPEDVVRPAYVTDPTAQMRIGFDGAATDDSSRRYREWFDANTLYSYFESAYPWTRLGYTYDWADNGREYGLSEFLILPESTVEVAFTLTTADFIRWMDEKTA